MSVYYEVSVHLFIHPLRFMHFNFYAWYSVLTNNYIFKLLDFLADRTSTLDYASASMLSSSMDTDE